MNCNVGRTQQGKPTSCEEATEQFYIAEYQSKHKQQIHYSEWQNHCALETEENFNIKNLKYQEQN